MEKRVYRIKYTIENSTSTSTSSSKRSADLSLL